MNDPLVGRVIGGRIEILALLGAGTMGAVYRARHQRLQRDIAVKVLHARGAMDTQLIERFRREAKAASSIDHPNAIRVFDFGEDGKDRVFYLAMELLEGEDLQKLITRSGRFEPARAVRMIAQVLAALDAAHARGIIHRDVKPANLMVLTGDQIKVCDFGLARMIDATEETDGAVEARRLTVTGTVVGTPAYMSPEQASGEELGPASDIYSTGVVLYELLSGRLPFTAESAVSLLVKHLESAPPLLAPLVPGLDSRLERAVYAAMDKDFRRRPSAAELREMLLAALPGRAGSSPTARPYARLAPERQVSRPARRIRWSAAAAVALLVAAGGGLVAIQRLAAESSTSNASLSGAASGGAGPSAPPAAASAPGTIREVFGITQAGYVLSMAGESCGKACAREGRECRGTGSVGLDCRRKTNISTCTEAENWILRVAPVNDPPDPRGKIFCAEKYGRSFYACEENPHADNSLCCRCGPENSKPN